MRGVRRLLKRAEKANKRLTTFLLSKIVRAHAGEIDPSKVSRVLFLRYDRLGDMVISTPLFRILKKVHPNWRIGVLGTSRNVDVIAGDPNVDDIFLFVRNPFSLVRTVLTVRRCRYDVVVNLVFYRSLTGGLLATLLGPKAHKAAVDNGNCNFLYNQIVRIRGGNEIHMVDRTLQLLEIFGIDPGRYDRHPHLLTGLKEKEEAASFFSLHNIEKNDSPVIGFNLSAGKDECRWTLEKYAACGLRIRERYPSAKIVLFTSPEEISRARTLQAMLPDVSIVCPPSKQIREVAAVVERTDLLVTPDTGMIHVASALRVPVVGLFTRIKSLPESWGPYGVPNRIVIAGGREPVSAIDSDEVFRAAADLIDAACAQTVSHREELSFAKNAVRKV